jgi:hypothetical protein
MRMVFINELPIQPMAGIGRPERRREQFLHRAHGQIKLS